MDKLKEFLKSLPLPLRVIAIIAVGALILLGTLQGCALKFNASGSADNYNILNIVVNTELMRIYSPAPKHYNILNIIINTDYYL